MTGHSRGVAVPSSSVNNQVDDYINGFVQPGLYAFVKLKPDSSLSPFKYLKVDLGVASRTGTFDLGNSNLARITSSSVDLAILLPFSFPVAKDIEAYVALGCILSYQYKRGVIATQPANVNLDNAFNVGFGTDIGFKFKSGSAIGYRVMTQFNDYPCRVGAIFFAFCPTHPSKWKSLR